MRLLTLHRQQIPVMLGCVRDNCSGVHASVAKEIVVTEQDNIAIVRRLYTDVFDQQDLALVDTLVAPHFKNHAAPPGLQDGPQSIKAVVKMLFAAFADDRCEVEDIFASGDRVAARVRHHGTHTGTYMGVAGSGRHVSQAELHIIRLEHGHWVEHWGVRDDLGFLRQMQSAEAQPARA
jgi:predicted ester cyclase